MLRCSTETLPRYEELDKQTVLLRLDIGVAMTPSPIIPWLGGKRRLADRLLALFPPHECYVEVFAGGAALYFLRPMPAKTEVLNDVNGELINLYRVVQNHLEEFVRQFKWALSSRQVFKWLQDTRPETLTDIQRAARFFYLQQHAFGGRVDGQSFGTATTGPAINLCRIEENLSAAYLRLAGTYVENLTWLDCAERYDRPHTFFYMDPPYWQTEGYGVDFPFENYQRMADFMRRCKGKVMVSINDHPDIREAFAGFQIEQTSLKYSVANQRQGGQAASSELVIMNWQPEVMGGLF
jgi:DNA adenine methylase